MHTHVVIDQCIYPITSVTFIGAHISIHRWNKCIGRPVGFENITQAIVDRRDLRPTAWW